MGKGQSKKSFFADVGENPSSSELDGESFGGSETPKQTKFKIPDLKNEGSF